MAVDYTTTAAVKAQLGITDDDDNDAINKAIAAASRAIDLRTGTSFGVTEATARVFGSCGGTVLLDRFTDTADLVVKTGSRGTYGTTVAATSYVLRPYNAPARGLAYDSLDFPGSGVVLSWDGWPQVEITARWGWHFIPDDVEQAARIKAARLYRRKDTPEGTGGTSEYGVVTISRNEDPDVILLLAEYTDPGIA